jgi:hypothetical protein
MTEPPKLKLARDQLARVQVAAYDPGGLVRLGHVQLLCTGERSGGAADHFGVQWKPNHPSKVEAARLLANQHGLPDIADLLIELNTLRKSEAYGEVSPSPTRSAEDIAIEVEQYVDALATLLGT